MSKITEVIDSLTDENVSEVKEKLTQEATALNENNRQLYSRAKKAEGFEYNKETKEWVKKEEKPTEKKPKESKKTNNELGYGEKAFLVANGIKGAKETELAQSYLDNGKSLEEVVESKHFQNDLKDLRDITAVNEAVKGPERTGTVAKNSVEYWVAKGELPPVSETQLRRDVVNAKMKTSKEKGMFYNSK